ncbi:hypothetical protein [Streptomyces sp. NPDC005898]|uniref:hypothetical protein n=1 Tax=Streptomyces sp. NPDC005898 TaxID=3157082 RepID=UPI0033D7B0FE
MSVADSDDSVSGVRVVQAIKAFSAEHGVGVAREVPDLKNPDAVRHLYMTPGAGDSSAATWLDEGYPEFSRNYETRVHPISEVGQQDPRGSYYVFGAAGAADDLVAMFSDLGLNASVTHPLSYTELADTYSGDPLFRALCVIALTALTMTGASVLLNAKTYGVLRMQGMSFTGILLRDLRQMAVFWPVSAVVVAVVTLVSLGLYNEFAWFGLFASVAVGIAAFLLFVVLATHAAVLALTFKVDVLRALKGELPSRAATVSVYLVRIPALLLALSIAASVSLAARDVLTREENRDRYEAVGDAVSIRLSGAYAMQQDQLDKRVGPWLREADKRGEVVVAGRRDLQGSAPDARLPAGEILIVNEKYLAEQPVLDAAGRRLARPAGGGKKPDSRAVRVIVPAPLAAQTSVITKAAAQIIDPDLSRDIPLETLTGKQGQYLFGYNTGSYVYNAGHSPNEDRSVVRDPVVVVVPNGSNFLTNDAYTTFATQGGIVFPNPEEALNGIKAEKLQDYVNSVSPIGQKTALDLRKAANEMSVQVFNLAVAVLVLLAAGVGVCIIYSRKNAQRIFVQSISGWRYVATHRFILAVEVAIAIIFATRVPFEVWQQNQELKDFAAAGAPAPYEPLHITTLDIGVITALVVFAFGAVLIALALFHRRIVKEGAAVA